MKQPNEKIERYRIMVHGGEWAVGTNNGAFFVPSPEGPFKLKVIASNGGGWDHVSVSLENRCPTWLEMCAVKDLFFKEDEVAVQFHVAKKDHISVHHYCLHLWRPQTREERIEIEKLIGAEADHWEKPGPFPMPPKEAIA